MLKRTLWVIGIALVAAGLLSWQLDSRWRQPLAVPQAGYELTVASGQTLASVAAQLKRDDVYPDDWLLRLYGRWTGIDQQIRRGEYLVPQGTTPEGLLALLQSGKVISYQVTLPEGITLAMALDILAQQPELEQVLQGPRDPKLLSLTGSDKNPEGLFFPDSYHFERGASDWEIMRRAYNAMQIVLSEEWEGRAEGLPYETPYEALIMASIVERETGLPSERTQIAGVFVRRLEKGMRLQTDPTIIYGLGDQYQGNIKRVHLRDDNNPYNTYRIKALPPTPIALPGRAAIHAALHPADGNTLYFVARGDGGHQFSATLAEHQAAVRQYQLRRREDYRSSPEQN